MDHLQSTDDVRNNVVETIIMKYKWIQRKINMAGQGRAGHNIDLSKKSSTTCKSKIEVSGTTSLMQPQIYWKTKRGKWL